MMQPIYVATGSLLHRLHPLSKVIAMIPVFIFLNLVTTLWTPLTFIVLHLMILLVLGRIPFVRLIQVVAPLLMTLIGFLIFYPPFVNSTLVAGSPILFSLGAMQVRSAGVLFSVTTCARLLSLSMVMLVCMLTTDANDLVRALVQQWHVNYRIGYGVMVAYRFIPMLEREVRLIRAAHKVRGVSAQRGLRGEYERARRALLPLLASAIRSAERKALAMDARAFGAFPVRTYYRRLSFTRADWLCVAVYWLTCLGAIGILLWRGLLLF